MSLTYHDRPAPPLSRLVLAFVSLYLIWGSTYLAIRVAIETLPPFLMAGARFFAAGVILYAFCRAFGDPAPRRGQWLPAFVTGGLLLVGGNGLVVWAEHYIPSGVAALLIGATPFIMVFFEYLRDRSQRPTARDLASLVVGFSGVLVLVAPHLRVEGSFMYILACLACLGACTSWAAGSVMSRRVALPRSILMTVSMQMIAGGLLMAALGTGLGEWSRYDLTAGSLRSWVAFFYLMVFGSLVGFSAYVYVLHHTKPALASSYAFVNPIVAVILGWALANEALTLSTALATGLIVAAVALLTLRKRPPRPQPAPVAVESTAALPAVAVTRAVT